MGTVPNGLFPAVSMTRQIASASRCARAVVAIVLGDVRVRLMDARENNVNSADVNKMTKPICFS
jgi:hypothetical protein